MKLKRLEITGFKSFMGKTRIVFPPGTTGVVGPNGCGKSNLVDALRWVMGEQNIRKLRGKTSEDIIFAGSAGNPPMNMAEVSLTIDNEDASIVGPFNEYSEITVTRRIYRSGETQALINRQPARLKDIQTLFLGSGTGKNAFAVIQQGNIGALTDATPDERRTFIEEAADVTKYKARKRETETRIKSTRENLERVGDIIVELKRQLDTLKLQAKKAILFKELQQDIRDIDCTLAGAEYISLGKKAHALEHSTHRVKQQTQAGLTRREALSSAMDRLKLHAQTTADALETHTRKIFELKRLSDRNESKIAHLKERSLALTQEVESDTKGLASAQKKSRSLAEEIGAIHNANGDLDDALTTLTKKKGAAEQLKLACLERLSQLEQEGQSEATRHMELVSRESASRHRVESAEKLKESALQKLSRHIGEQATVETDLIAATQRKKSLEKEGADLKGEATELTGFAETIREELQGLKKKTLSLGNTLKQKEIEESRVRSFIETMERMVLNHEGCGDGVKAGIKHLVALGTNGNEVVANLIQVENGYETAVETALGEILTHIVVQSSASALQGAMAMVQNGTSRCGFLPATSDTLSPFDGPVPEGCRPISDVVTLNNSNTDALAPLLSRLFVAEDLSDAIQARAQTRQWVAIATTDGSLVDFSGAVIAGKKGASASLLKRRTEILGAREHLTQIEADINDLATRQIDLNNKARHREESLRQAESEERQLRQTLSKNERACLLAGEEVRQGEKRRTLMALERDQWKGDLADLETEVAANRKTSLALREALAQGKSEAAVAREKITDARRKLTLSEQAIAARNVDLAREEAKHDSHRDTVARLTHFLQEGEVLAQSLEGEIKKKGLEIQGCDKQIGTLEKVLTKAFDAITAEEEALAATRTRLSRIEGDTLEKETERKELITLHEERSETLRKEEVALAGFLTRLEELRTRTLEQYQTPIETLNATFQEKIHGLLQGDVQREDLKGKLVRLKRKIHRIGDVNAAAVTQYEEMKERHGFLSDQQKDLTASLDDLESIIRKINRITQERFVETFHRINEKLEEIFPKLFEGGSARLVLTDPSKPLETGVELMIQPPGKKQARLSLLSGGEKALSAIAFVFSIFLLKPSSFCVMDEIDAPLDDANVLRFNNLLTLIAESSQILVITHNKITMEHADILIGVTMEKKGTSKVVSVNLSGKEISLETPEAESA